MKKALKLFGVIVLVAVVGVAIAVLVLASRLDGKLAMPDTPYPDIKASTDPVVIAKGETLVRSVAHCTQCHGAYDRMKPQDNTATVELSGGLEFDMGPLGRLYAPNLTSDAETGIGKRTDAELARTLAAGVMADGRLSIFMRYSAAKLSTEDLTAVVSYLRSLPPVKKVIPKSELALLGRAVFSLLTVSANTKAPPKHVAPAEEPSLERGEYLAENVALCIACHTQYDPMTIEPTGPKAAGGNVEPSHGTDEDMEYAPPNLTSDPKVGMTGILDEDAFVARIRRGRAYVSSIMPWENLARATDADLRSIYRYLRSLPPSSEDRGPGYREAGWKPKS